MDQHLLGQICGQSCILFVISSLNAAGLLRAFARCGFLQSARFDQALQPGFANARPPDGAADHQCSRVSAFLRPCHRVVTDRPFTARPSRDQSLRDLAQEITCHATVMYSHPLLLRSLRSRHAHQSCGTPKAFHLQIGPLRTRNPFGSLAIQQRCARYDGVLRGLRYLCLPSRWTDARRCTRRQAPSNHSSSHRPIPSSLSPMGCPSEPPQRLSRRPVSLTVR